MELSQIQELLRQPTQKSKIGKAISHDDRIRFHSNSNFDIRGKADTVFLDWVRTILPKDKFSVFASLFKYPIDTLPLTSEVYQALSKIFDGHDADHVYMFDDAELLADWHDYKNNHLNYSEFWRIDAFAKIKNEIGSIIVADVPSEQTTQYPEPYFYFLDLSNVIHVESNGNDIESILFRVNDGLVAFYDSESYRTFKVKDSTIISEETNSNHELGYCPATFFWSDRLSEKNVFLRKSPLSDYLAKLDWLLFYEVSKKYSDLYSPWTIYWGYTQDCDYDDEPSGYYCDAGFLRDRDNRYLYNHDQLMPCPKCCSKIAGVGSYIDVPPPNEDTPAMAPPVGKIDVDINSLNYNVTEIDRLSKEIYRGVTGNSLDVVGSQAVNEKQVYSLFEDRKQVLMSFKRNFEKAHEWVSNTICKLRYGDRFIGCSINYGSEFYLFSASDLLNMYSNAKSNDVDVMVLDMLQDSYINTSYKNNPYMLNRSNTIKAIDPFRHSSLAVVQDMYRKGEVSYEDYYLKMNLSTLVGRFERERGNIGEFLKDSPQGQRIELIREILMSYIPIFN